jgi:hypothetical protein
MAFFARVCKTKACFFKIKKTDSHDISEILLKVALNTMTLTLM